MKLWDVCTILPTLFDCGLHTLDTTFSLTSGYHPQPNGQAEWANQDMEPWAAWHHISLVHSHAMGGKFHSVLDILCMLLSVLAPKQHFLVFLFPVPERQFPAMSKILTIHTPWSKLVGPSLKWVPPRENSSTLRGFDSVIIAHLPQAMHNKRPL